MKYGVSIIFILFNAAFAMTQGICSGNLGDNIFTDGDFGSGTALVVPNNPNIAPGYNYTTQVPSDGSYTICSRTSALSGLYPSWLQIEDNSSDPNGYMMVINASFEPGIFYEEIVNDLCENTLYEFSADIINLIRIGTSNHTDPNVTFLIDDEVVYETGTIPKTEQWVKFGFSFVTTSTQSSIKLTLRNNAPGGSGNDLALDNISFRPCGPSSFIDLEGESSNIFLCIDDDPLTVVADIVGDNGEAFAILWQSSLDSMNWETITGNTSSSIQHTDFELGIYYYRYFSAGNEINIQNEKCRIISDILKITVLPDTYPIQDTTCIGEQYQFGPQILVSAGFYSENFESSRGCDSTVLLDLTFIPEQPIIIDYQISDPSCFEFSDGSIAISQLSGGYGGLEFEVFDEFGGLVSSDLTAGDYTIVANDRFNCKESLAITLNQPDEVIVELGTDTTLRLGQDIIISPEYSQLFSNTNWTVNGEIDCDDCASVTLLPFSSSYVVASVSGDNNCIDTDSFFLTVIEENLVHLPNIFSPNNDGINDFMTFNYFARSVSSIEQFSVYDRWGGLVHNIKNVPIANGESIWDGYSDNEILPNGVYTYYLNLIYINGTNEELIKSITVLR
ncbi:MAG: gliding motility-associated-like protein [Saprospiraceae bacterium]|jgi:gliding motility-associated-like protein